MSGPRPRGRAIGRSSAHSLSLRFHLGRPADDFRVAGKRLVENGFRRGDPEAGPDKGRQEAVELHVQESGHAMPAAHSQRKREDAGNRVRILVKRFIEIADAQ